jgi:adenylate cyclase
VGSISSAIGVRKIRLAAGLVLFTYAALHLANHALGNVSIAAMEAGLAAQKFLWQGTLGTLALYAALATHLALGLWALFERRHFGWTRREVTQLVLALTIPLLLANHLAVTRISLAFFGTEKGYAQELYSFWVGTPRLGALQVAALIVVWIHGCIGVAQWLRLKAWFARAMPLLLTAAVLLPVLALLGFFQGGRTILALAHDPAWRAANLTPGQVGLPAENAALASWRDAWLAIWPALIGLVLLARGVRAWRERRGAAIRVTYPDGRSALVPRGFSVLEASRAARIAHTSICGGRGRCSTCRVRVIAGTSPLPAPSAGEQAVLARVRAGPDVRLACQLRPSGNLVVVPLLPAGSGRIAPKTGEERFIVALVADMRNSVRLAETRLPFDAVFIVERFVAAVAEAVVAAGGQVTQFTGDGLLATFGLAATPAQAARQAVAAVARIGAGVAALNRVLASELKTPLRFGVGVHGSAAVVGEIGIGAARVFTTLGDAANTAARLEALCKEFGCEAVISEDVCRLAGLQLAVLPQHEVALRGRSGTLLVRTAGRAAGLAAAAAA